ncbi:MAG: flagellar basal body-associated FliL family protein [Anaerolineaceae bacterium]|nr:flagellar basal body-associated FliL family protein [Anaerolineaceae bacterium]
MQSSMGNFNKILNLVLRILAIAVMLTVCLVSLSTAYIMFAPDNLPKPFYLQYHYPTPSATPTAPLATQTPTPRPTPQINAGEGVMVNSGTKIINLADPTGKKYIRITIVLEFAPPDTSFTELKGEARQAALTTFNTDVTGKMPLVDDVIITLLSTKTFDMLYTSEGKESLRLELRDKLNQRLHEYRVISVYFTEFVID